MIGVSITAVKGGFRELYRTQNLSQSIAREIRHDSGSGFSIGQEAYSIFFVSGGVVFSKCRIVTDGMGGRRVGNVNIALFIPNSHKLSGEDVEELLDKLLKVYCDNYAKGNNLDNVYEDWTFVNTLTAPYENKLKPNDEEMQSGTSGAAFVYYDDYKLQDYFDAPYQDEYSAYKQVFFVQKKSEDKPENPLNALRHDSNANLTGKIDLENPKYKIFYNKTAKGGIKIEFRIKVGDEWKERDSGSKIRKKNELQIIYSKPYYQKIVKTGRWKEIGSEFVLVDDNAQTVTVKEIDLEEDVKPIPLVITNNKGESVTDVTITVDILTFPYNDSISFKGEEIGKQHKISAQKGNTFFSEEILFTPKDQHEPIKLTLKERRIVRISANDEANGNTIYNFSVYCENHKSNNQKITEIEFIGEEIDKTWNMSLSHKDYHSSENKPFCPRDKSEINFQLKKKENTNEEKRPVYKIDAGGNGRIAIDSYISVEKNTDPIKAVNDMNNIIIPHEGYKCIGYKLDQNRSEEGCAGVLVAQYRKKKPFYKRYVFWALFPIVCFLVFAILCNKGNFEPETKIKVISKQHIETYLNGNVFDTDSLNIFKSCCADLDESARKSNKADEERHFGNNGATTSTLCSKVEKALAYCTAIKDGDIDKLSITVSDYKDEISAAMKEHYGKEKKIDKQDVNTFIANLQKLLKIDVSSLKDVADCNKALDDILGLHLPEIGLVKTVKDQVEQKKRNLVEFQPKPPIPNPPPTNPDKDIEDYLKGDQLILATLKEYKEKTNNVALKNSIEYCEGFWKMCIGKKPQPDFQSLNNKIKNDKYLKNSELEMLVKKMSTSSDFEKKWKGINTSGKNNDLTSVKNLSNKWDNN